MKTLKGVVIAMLVAALMTTAAGCSGDKGDAQVSPGPDSQAAAKATPGAVRYQLTVEGMACPEGCPPNVKAALESIEGVRSVEVDFDTKTAVVTADPGTVLTTEICDKSFANQGYFVSALSALPAAD